MIPGFEEYTADVKSSEIETINLIARSLEKRVGVKNAITNAEMRKGLYFHSGINLSSPKIRKYIQYIRAYKLVPMLCASSNGYWVAKDNEEWIKYREAFRSRVNSMKFTLHMMDMDTNKNNVLT